MTTTASRNNPFFLTVALSAGGWARGDLFWDDGESVDTFEMQNYCYVIFTAEQVSRDYLYFHMESSRDFAIHCDARLLDAKSVNEGQCFTHISAFTSVSGCE